MHTKLVARELTTLLRVPLDDALLTLMLLNDQPIIAVASEDEPGRADFCHIVRVDRRWIEA